MNTMEWMEIQRRHPLKINSEEIIEAKVALWGKAHKKHSNCH
jgi:hypothetical protein